MKKYISFIAAILFLTTGSAFAGPELKAPIVVAYFPSWGIYHNYSVDKIPAKNVDVINYAFGNINKDTCQVELADPNADDKNIPALAELKKQQPNLKIIYSLGGWNNSVGFYYCAADTGKRELLANSIKDFLNKYPVFDGIDLDWEFPVAGGEAGQPHSPQDKINYVELVKAIRQVIGNEKYLTIAGPPAEAADPTQSASITNLDLGAMAPFLDFVNVMTYDYHGAWESTTNNLAPLYQDPQDPDVSANKLNVDTAIKTYIKLGVPANKLVMGVPAYGIGWNVQEAGPEKDGLFVAGTPITEPKPDSGVNFKYSTIVDSFLNGKLIDNENIYFNDQAKTSVYYHDGQVISFDTPAVLETKANYVMGKYLNSDPLLGVMIWDLSQDSCAANSLTYNLSKDLGRPGTTEYACPPPIPNNTLEVTNTSSEFGLNAISIQDGGAYYVLTNPKYQTAYFGPEDDASFNRDSGPTIAKLEGKTGLKVLITPTFGQQYLCSDNSGVITFDFTKNIHIMVNAKTKACAILPM